MQFLATLRQAVPDAVVTKYNDRLTSGIPDASVTWGGRTIWMEFKARPSRYRGTLTALLRHTNRHAAVQLYMLWRLAEASKGRAFVVLFEPSRVLSLWSPINAQQLALVMRGAACDISAHLRGLCEN